jgi:hypothetical protein
MKQVDSERREFWAGVTCYASLHTVIMERIMDGYEHSDGWAHACNIFQHPRMDIYLC